MKIIILNLNKNTEESKVEKLFAKYGAVKSCKLVTDKETGKSKGFGFVEMDDEIAANRAITALHGSMVSGSKVRVKISDNVSGNNE
jgi:RNA recognition motif-containing protein